MHEPIVGNIEEYLSGVRIPQIEDHLKQCEECRSELALMMEHSTMLRSLQVTEGVEPVSGFYARVMNRIETQVKPSVWTLFGESLFARRLAFASMAFVLVLSAAFLANPPGEVLAPGASPEVIIAAEQEESTPSLGYDQVKDREAILVQLATYSD